MDSDNPYQAPDAVVADAQPQVSAPLFRTSGIYIATFIGSALAGGWVIAMNHAALGQFALARKARWSGLAATLVVVVLAMLLPEQVPGVVYMVVQMVAVSSWIKQTPLGDAIGARVAAKLPMRSNWLAAGIGLLGIVAVMAGLVIVAGIAMYVFGIELV